MRWDWVGETKWLWASDWEKKFGLEGWYGWWKRRVAEEGKMRTEEGMGSRGQGGCGTR